MSPGGVRQRVAIIGGGLAGLAAAVRLVEAGCEPIVIETRKKLGGRATSFDDPRSGRTLDNCQHVVLGCCTNLLDFYERIGVADLIEWHRTLYWTDGGGEVDTLCASRWLPAPAHLSPAMQRMKMFSAKDKRHIARAMWRMIRGSGQLRLAYRDRTFADFLGDCKQPPEVVRRFWNTIVVSACNLNVDRVGASYALQVFQEGFLGNSWSYTMGLPDVPLRALYDPALDIIEGGGGQVRLGTSVKSIAYGGSRVRGVVTGDDLIEAAAVISTVPPDRLDKLVSQTMREADSRLLDLDQFEFSPILGVHLVFDQAAFELPHLVLVDMPTHWVFNKGVDADGHQHLHAVISAADGWMDLDEAAIVGRVMADLERAMPSMIGLRPIEARAVKEKRATFAPTPRTMDIRPGVMADQVRDRDGGIENLYIAGDWADVGWPATMEGAVRSGYIAAGGATDRAQGAIDDVPNSFIAALLGLGR